MQSKFLQFKKKCGESLVEVIIAIFIVAMGSGVATTLIVSAMQSNEFSRDNLIALNLAVEGMEAMRGMRDANWLKFSYNKEGCWNMRPEVEDCTDVMKAKPIAAGNYVLDLDVTPNKYRWDILKINTAALNLDGIGDNTPYQLSYYDVDPEGDSDGDTNKGNDRDVLAKDLLKPGLAESPFYRMVNIAYPEDAPCSDSGENCSEMDVTSIVQWRAQNVKHQVVMTTKLTNYQKVK